VLVELDGRIHLEAIRRWRDMRRDNRSTLRAEATLRYGFIDVRQQPCEVAVQVLAVLRSRGFTGRVRACGRGCPVR
jgi:very-short-patch-repair endonuclease